MEKQKAITEYWQKFCQEANISAESTPYEAWSFGDSSEMADELLALVLIGKKTGSASAYDSYILDGEALPAINQYSIILNSQNKPKCVILSTAVEKLRFKEVTATHSRKEGEGDCSLAYWRRVHQSFWERELATTELQFSEEMWIIFEEFKVIYQ